MRGTLTFSLIALAAVAAVAPQAEAQQRRRVIVPIDASVPTLRVRPRSFLDPGVVVIPGDLDRTTSGYAQTQAYLLSPPYAPNRERFSEGVLPDPITNGPYVGARNPFPPIDFNGPIDVRQR
jgi:hypothetical protein